MPKTLSEKYQERQKARQQQKPCPTLSEIHAQQMLQQRKEVKGATGFSGPPVMQTPRKAAAVTGRNNSRILKTSNLVDSCNFTLVLDQNKQVK